MEERLKKGRALLNLLKFKPPPGPQTAKSLEMSLVSNLLKFSLASPDPSRALPPISTPVSSFSKQTSTHSLIDQIVGQLVVSGFNSTEARLARSRVSYVRSTEGTNILAYGYTYSREAFTSSTVASVKSMPSGVSRTAGVSSNVQDLKGGAWRKIHDEVGDECIVRLLKEAAVVCRVETGAGPGEGTEEGKGRHNFYQLAGIPLFVQAPNYGVSGVKGKVMRFQGEVEGKVGKEIREGKRMKGYEGKGMEVEKRSNKGGDERGEKGGEKEKKKLESNIGERDTVIPRFKIFYSNTFSKQPGLPTGHPWNKRLGEGVEVLAREAGSVVWNGSPRRKKRCKGLEELLAKTIKRHRKYDYCRSIQRFCPLGRAYERREKTPPTLADVSKMFTPTEGVQGFLRDAVVNVFPEGIFGGKENWELVISGVEQFVSARTSEGFDARRVVTGMKTSSISWLSTLHPMTPAQRNLAN
ncbi:hypothetical protein TrRE_jg4024, partial [Triparma retinervis]